MKATRLLESQHRDVEKLFRRINASKGEDEVAVAELSRSLLAHMIIEQTLFSNAITGIEEDLALEAYEEHAVARFEIGRMLYAKGGALFESRVTTLEELIERHVEKEEKDLFPKVDKALSGEQLEGLGESMQALYDQLIKRDLQALFDRTRRTGEDAARTLAA